MLRRALGILALVLLLAGSVGVRRARAAPNYLIIVYNAICVSAFEPLVDLRESLDWDREESGHFRISIWNLTNQKERST